MEDTMADQPALSEGVTPEQFFEQMLPMGFAAQAQQGGDGAPREATMQYHVTGPGGGDWTLVISGGEMKAGKGSADANVTFTVSVDDWRDAVLGRDGATLGLIVPQPRPGRPDNSARALALKGTLALELSRDGKDPFKVDMCFNNAAAPKTIVKMKLAEFVDMQTGKLNGQEAFMTGKLRVEGDIGFLMQIGQMVM
jgi:putative sterol carrier protein